MSSIDLKARFYNGVKEFVASPKARVAAAAITLAALGALSFSSEAMQKCLNPIPNCPETGMISLRKENCYDFIAGLFGSSCNFEVLGPCLPCITPETICTQAAPYAKATLSITAAIAIGIWGGLYCATDKKPSNSKSGSAKPSVSTPSGSLKATPLRSDAATKFSPTQLNGLQASANPTPPSSTGILDLAGAVPLPRPTGAAFSKQSGSHDPKKTKHAAAAAPEIESLSNMDGLSARTPPRLPTMREIRHGEESIRHNDSLCNRPPVPLPNKGNTCFAASLAQAWLFDKESAIQAKINRLQRAGQDTSTAERLLSFIKEYRKASSENRAADIMPLMEALRGIHPSFGKVSLDYLEKSKEEFLASIDGDNGCLSWFKNQVTQLQVEIKAIRDGSRPSSQQESEKLASILQSKTAELGRTAKITLYLKGLLNNKGIDPAKLQGKLEELGVSYLLTPPPQQDVQEMIQFLYDFIYGDIPDDGRDADVIRQQSFVALKLEDKESLLLDTGSSDRVELGKVHQYSGCTFLTPDYKFQLAKGGQKGYSIEGRRSLPELFSAAFFEKDLNSTIRCLVMSRYEPIDKSVRIESQRTFLSKAPEQFVLSVKRAIVVSEEIPNSPQKKLVTYALRGSLENLDEIMEVPGDYFLDGKGATYRLDGVIVHKGGVSADSGHYTAVSRRFNQSTGASALYSCDDQTINLKDSGDLLSQAGEAYVLVFNKIS